MKKDKNRNNIMAKDPILAKHNKTEKLIKSKNIKDQLFYLFGFLILVAASFILFALISDLFIRGASRLNFDFLTHFPSRKPEAAGILSAWVGSLAVMLVTSSVSLVLGVMTGIYLEEYAPKNIFTFLIELAIVNMAGIPSITFGLMALGIFVYQFNFGQSILTAGLTLGLLVLPIIIVTTREALKSIPNHLREAAYSLGASKYQIVRDHLLPYSSGGILTGMILALSRAVGETAPLITIGALTFIAFLPTPPIQSTPPFVSFEWLWDGFTVLPIQMFNWVSRPQEEFHINAAATGAILLMLTLILNAGAIWLRYKFRKRYHW